MVDIEALRRELRARRVAPPEEVGLVAVVGEADRGVAEALVASALVGQAMQDPGIDWASWSVNADEPWPNLDRSTRQDVLRGLERRHDGAQVHVSAVNRLAEWSPDTDGMRPVLALCRAVHGAWQSGEDVERGIAAAGELLVQRVRESLPVDLGAAYAWIGAAREQWLARGPAFDTSLLRAALLIDSRHDRARQRAGLAGWFERPRLVQPFVDLVRPVAEGLPSNAWALHYLGPGGVGKTELIRHLASAPALRDDPQLDGAARARIAWADGLRFVAAIVDFDRLDPSFPSRRPALVLQRLAHELRRAVPEVDSAVLALDRLISEAHALVADHDVDAGWVASPEGAAVLGAFTEVIRSVPAELGMVVLVLDTCEELERVGGGHGVEPRTIATAMVMMEAAHARASDVVRVVFSGRRPLARAGAGWERRVGGEGWSIRPWLAVVEVPAFDAMEAQGFLARFDLDAPVVATVLAASTEPVPPSSVSRVGAAEPTGWYLPFHLRMFAELALSGGAEELRRVIGEGGSAGAADRYIQARIVGRAPDLAGLLPVVGLAGYADDALFALAGVRDEVKRLAHLDWVEAAPEGGLRVDDRVAAPLRAWFLRRASSDPAVEAVRVRLAESLLGPGVDLRKALAWLELVVADPARAALGWPSLRRFLLADWEAYHASDDEVRGRLDAVARAVGLTRVATDGVTGEAVSVAHPLAPWIGIVFWQVVQRGGGEDGRWLRLARRVGGPLAAQMALVGPVARGMWRVSLRALGECPDPGEDEWAALVGAAERTLDDPRAASMLGGRTGDRVIAAFAAMKRAPPLLIAAAAVIELRLRVLQRRWRLARAAWARAVAALTAGGERRRFAGWPAGDDPWQRLVVDAWTTAHPALVGPDAWSTLPRPEPSSGEGAAWWGLAEMARADAGEGTGGPRSALPSSLAPTGRVTTAVRRAWHPVEVAVRCAAHEGRFADAWRALRRGDGEMHMAAPQVREALAARYDRSRSYIERWSRQSESVGLESVSRSSAPVDPDALNPWDEEPVTEALRTLALTDQVAHTAFAARAGSDQVWTHARWSVFGPGQHEPMAELLARVPPRDGYDGLHDRLDRVEAVIAAGLDPIDAPEADLWAWVAEHPHRPRQAIRLIARLVALYGEAEAVELGWWPTVKEPLPRRLHGLGARAAAREIFGVAELAALRLSSTRPLWRAAASLADQAHDNRLVRMAEILDALWNGAGGELSRRAVELGAGWDELLRAAEQRLGSGAIEDGALSEVTERMTMVFGNRAGWWREAAWQLAAAGLGRTLKDPDTSIDTPDRHQLGPSSPNRVEIRSTGVTRLSSDGKYELRWGDRLPRWAPIEDGGAVVALPSDVLVLDAGAAGRRWERELKLSPGLVRVPAGAPVVARRRLNLEPVVVDVGEERRASAMMKAWSTYPTDWRGRQWAPGDTASGTLYLAGEAVPLAQSEGLVVANLFASQAGGVTLRTRDVVHKGSGRPAMVILEHRPTTRASRPERAPLAVFAHELALLGVPIVVVLTAVPLGMESVIAAVCRDVGHQWPEVDWEPVRQELAGVNISDVIVYDAAPGR